MILVLAEALVLEVLCKKVFHSKFHSKTPVSDSPDKCVFLQILRNFQERHLLWNISATSKTATFKFYTINVPLLKHYQEEFYVILVFGAADLAFCDNRLTEYQILLSAQNMLDSFITEVPII